MLDSTVVAELAAKKLHASPADAPALLEHLTVENPIGTLILNITYAAVEPRGRADGRAGVRRRVPRAPAADRRRGEGTRARAAAEPAHRPRPGAERRARHDRGHRRSAPTPGPPPRHAATSSSARSPASSRRARRSTGVDTSPGQLIRPADLPGRTERPVAGAAADRGGRARRHRRRRHRALPGADRPERREPARASPRCSAPSRWPSSPPLALGAPWRVAMNPADPTAINLRRLRVAVWPRRGSGPHRVMVTTPVGHDERRRAGREPRAHVGPRRLERAARVVGPPGGVDAGAGPADAARPARRRAAREAARAGARRGGSGVAPDPHAGRRPAARRPTRSPSGWPSSTAPSTSRSSSARRCWRRPRRSSSARSSTARSSSSTCSGTAASELERCIDALSSTGTPVLGVVAVSVPSSW